MSVGLGFACGDGVHGTDMHALARRIQPRALIQTDSPARCQRQHPHRLESGHFRDILLVDDGVAFDLRLLGKRHRCWPWRLTNRDRDRRSSASALPPCPARTFVPTAAIQTRLRCGSRSGPRRARPRGPSRAPTRPLRAPRSAPRSPLPPRLRWFRIARVPRDRDRPAAAGACPAPSPRRAHRPQEPGLPLNAAVDVKVWVRP